MYCKVSVIVPYFNESATIEKTLVLLKKQTFQPKEVLLINSSSTDDTYIKINKWIFRNKLNYYFKNINSNSKNPSSSKNIGIKKSKFEWLAFMDCDLYFKNNWLSQQIECLKKNNSKISIGVCSLESKNLIDIACIAQTWGYSKRVPVIPSSLIHKSVFREIGYFDNRRAGYDRAWLKKANIINTYQVNNKCIIKYSKLVHADNFIDYFKKIFIYSKSSYGLKNFYNPYIYFLFFFLSLLLVLKNNIFFYVIFFYIIIRGYLFPLLKSSKIIFFLKKPLLFFYFPLAGFLTDLSRLFGYFFGIFKSFKSSFYTNLKFF
jgi:glycosyltransferase involved in cell wall biosynthesis